MQFARVVGMFSRGKKVLTAAEIGSRVKHMECAEA